MRLSLFSSPTLSNTGHGEQAQDTARELGVIAERTGQRFDAIEKRLDQVGSNS